MVRGGRAGVFHPGQNCVLSLRKDKRTEKKVSDVRKSKMRRREGGEDSPIYNIVVT